MKKILAIALVLVMVVALAVPVFAADSPTAPGAPANGAAPAGAPGQSPQTGYNTIVWVISAVAMAICAGYCFSKAGKKVAC